MFKISILITYYKRFEQFSRGINSLLLQDFNKNDVELVFLNDSGDKEVFQLLKTYSKIISINYFENISRIKSVTHSASRRNFLIRQSRGNFLLFCEPEIIHASNTIALVNKAFTEYGEKIWYCGKVYATKEVVSKNGYLTVFSKKHSIVNNINLGSKPGCLNRIDTSFFKKNKKYHLIKPWAHIPHFWNTALSTKYLLKVKGFNENLVKWGYEETELFFRLSKIGIKRIYDRNFISYHCTHKTTMSVEERCLWDIYNRNVPFQNNLDWGSLQGVKMMQIQLS